MNNSTTQGQCHSDNVSRKKMIQAVSQAIIEETREKARHSPRKRAIFKFHQPEDRMQRMINVLLHGTYVQPHQHTDPPKIEHFTVLEGEIACVEFDTQGSILQVYRMNAQGPIYGVDIPSGVIHALVCLTPEAVLHEVIDGIFNPKTHKQFASFAPTEGSPEANTWLTELEKKI